MRDVQVKIYFADRDDKLAVAHVTTIRSPRAIKVMVSTDEDVVEMEVRDNGKLDVSPI